MRSYGGRSVVFGVAVGCFVGQAHGQELSQFAYQSPPGCPQRAEFLARVHARQSALTAGQIDAALGDLLAHVEVEPSGKTGRLEFRDELVASRHVAANNCDEVVTGLALIAGVSLERPMSTLESSNQRGGTPRAPAAGDVAAADPDGASGQSANFLETTTAPSAGSGLGVAPTPSAAVAASTTERPASTGVTRRSGPSEGRIAPALRPSDSSSPRDAAAEIDADDAVGVRDGQVQDGAWNVGFGVGAGAWTAFERPQFRAAGFVELAPRSDAWTLRVTGFASPATATDENWGVDWTVYGGRVETCPVSWRYGWSLGGCVMGELGMVGVEGRSHVGGAVRDERLLWADAGIGVRGSSPSAWGLNLEAQLGVAVPFTRYEWKFESPAATLGNVPAATLFLELGLRFRPGSGRAE